MVHEILAFIVPLAVAALVAAVNKFLNADSTTSLVSSLAAKGAAETTKLMAEADATHNALVQMAVHYAMNYAENHSADLIGKFDSKAEYVIQTIQADPRFAHLDLPTEQLKHIIEALFTQYFAGLPHSTPAAAPVVHAAPAAPAAPIQ